MNTLSTSFIKKMLLVFLVTAGLYVAKDFLIPFAIGGVLATLFLPFCKWMEKKKVPRIVASFICLFALLLAVAGFFALVGWQISSLVTDVSLVKQKVVETTAQLQQYLLAHFGISLNEQKDMLKNQQDSISAFLSSLAGSLSFILTSSILVLVYLLLLLIYRGHIKVFILKLSAAEQKENVEQVLLRATNVSQQYLVGLAKMIVCLWVMYGIGFSVLGVKNAILFAVICGFLEIVPFIGNITGTAITVLVAAVNGGSFAMLGGIVLTYGIVQLIQGWVLEPLILGPQVKINPFFTIIALVLGELIWGIPGIVLAIPLTAMFKIVCDHVESLKPYGFLIGEIETNTTAPNFVTRIKNWF
ncbi:MAG: AI-2E family transporter [Chitinophagales bacterium]